MRNWLRKWLGIDRLDKIVDTCSFSKILYPPLPFVEKNELERVEDNLDQWVKSQVDTDKGIVKRITQVEDSLKVLAALVGQQDKALDKRIGQLGDKVTEGINSDNAILKRLLAVEVFLGLAPKSDPLMCTLCDSVELYEGKVKYINNYLFGPKMPVHSLPFTLHKIETDLAEYRKEVKALKGGVVVADRDEIKRVIPKSLSRNKKAPAKPKKAR